ncbi:inverse autotransporter beta domain-containing protein (plasmid) [Salmonella enterica subsp. enterica serovar Kentucky]|nr:inverse autotransporter beta domain-containing protein [Salmonella enterica subsp. enterica serovar Kentucky]
MFDDINNHNLKDASAIKFIAWFTIIIQSLFPISMNFIPSFAVAQSNTLQQWDNVETQPYIIKDGETIDNVAKKLNLSFSQLAKLNQFRIFSRGFENVKPGDEIDVPVNTGTPGNAANTLPVKMLYSDSTSTNITRNMNKTTHAENFGFIRSSDSANDIARTMINSAATEEIQKWLSQWGTTRAQVNLDKKLSLDGNSIDTLIPIYNTEDNTFFTQFGIRNKNGRNIFNIGGGGRAIWDNWLLGINSFYDHDISGGNRRIGLGVEAWGNYIQLSANSYFRLNNWQQSRDFSDYNERPANGFDIRANAWLPSFPQLGGKLVYEQYFGNHVALQDNHTLQKNPYSLTAGLNYTPFPLLTLGIDQQFGKGGNNDTQLSLQLTYRPGSSWESQINPSSVSGIRQMSENRYNLVERNNNFIFEYKKQDLISITLSKDEISGPENSIHLVSGQVKSKYELSQILWDSDKYISAGGRVSVVNNKNFNLTLPAYKTNGTPGESVEEANTYNINFVATDKKGNKSNSATLKVIVTSSGHSASARFTGTPVVTGSPSPANGTTAVQVGFTVTDGSGNPLPDQDVVITYNDGTSEKSVTVKTDTSGVAQADVTGTRAGDTAVTAQVNGQAQQAVVKFVPDAVSARFTGTPVVTGSPAQADNSESITLTYKVIDKSGNTLPNQTITISVNNNAVSDNSSVVTDNQGEASFVVRNSQSGTTTVSASINSHDISTDIIFKPVIRTVVANKMLSAKAPVTGYAPVDTISTTAGVLTYSISPSLPAGLVLDSATGVISGTPAAASVVTTYTMTVRDGSSGAENSTTFSLGIAPALAVTQSLYSKVLSMNSNVNLTAINVTGGVSPVVSISPSLPQGLNLNASTGEITGIPTVETGATTYTISVTDQNASPVKRLTLSLTVAPGPVLTVNVQDKMATARASLIYTPVSSVSPVGGALTYSVSPTLPAGLGLNSTNGIISGTPAAASVVTTYTMTVRDGSSGAENSTTFSLGIAPALAVTQSLYSKVLSMNSNVNLTAINVTGGVSPVVSISPSLPQGLNLNASTGEITGIPTVETGATTYTISVTDQNASPVKRLTLSLTVAPGPDLTVNTADKMLAVGAGVNYLPVAGTSPVGGILSYRVSPPLPSGLGLNSTNGVISGTPRAVSSVMTYTMTVRDGRSGAENSVEFNISVLPRFVVTQTIYVRTVTSSTSVNIEVASVSGGSGTYRVSVSPALPTGLDLSIDATSGAVTVSGIPTAAASVQDYAITIQDDVVDGASNTRTLKLTVN